MNIGRLRQLIEKLPDDMEVIIESNFRGQKDAVSAEVCRHENGGLHYTDTERTESLNGGRDGLNPEGWDLLKRPTFRIGA